MQELGKFNLKIKVIANASFELYNITNKLSFIESIQFISSSLDSLFKHLDKENFTYLSQEIDNNILDLFKEK